MGTINELCDFNINMTVIIASMFFKNFGDNLLNKLRRFLEAAFQAGPNTDK